jgi:hypothetical protein
VAPRNWNAKVLHRQPVAAECWREDSQGVPQTILMRAAWQAEPGSVERSAGAPDELYVLA